MQIIRSQKFKEEFVSILEYIAKDKLTSALQFRKKLNESLKSISNFAFKYRKSLYFNDENIRDMTFYGYTIVYEVNSEQDSIEVLSIFNQNKIKNLTEDRF